MMGDRRKWVKWIKFDISNEDKKIRDKLFWISKTKFVKQSFNEPKWRLKYWNLLKEMIRNKNKPAKPPNPRIPKTQVGPHAKRNKNEGKESYQKIVVQT